MKKSGILFALVLAGCRGGSGTSMEGDAAIAPADASGNAYDAASAPDANAFPKIEAASCRFDLAPGLGLSEGSDYECGDLVVYENRDNPGRTIQVHFIRFFSPSSSGNATIYLEGGPGGNGSGMVARLGYLGQSFLDALMVDGDFLVIAQRGTSLSRPALDCDLDCQQITDDLGAYNTAYNADDVSDLRAALGYQALNVYGISYGSRLALEILRRHGSEVRTAIIGGLVPSHVVWSAGVPASFYSALQALDDSCAQDGGCEVAFGDLEEDFIAGVAALNADPLSLDGGNILLSGDAYAYLLFRLMYARSAHPWLPMMISDVAARRIDRIESFVVSVFGSIQSSSVAQGMYNSVVCGELFNPPDLDAFTTMNAGVPDEIRNVFSAGWQSMLDICSTWPKGNLQSALAEPVTSSVPTFVASGTIDPITPPAYGRLAADHLDSALVVDFENSGHGATVQTDCGRRSFLQFLETPDLAMDVTCAGTIGTDYVLPMQANARPVPRKAIALEMLHSPTLPEVEDTLGPAAAGK